MSRILGPDELKRFQALQDFFAVDPTAKRIEDFGKWVFTAVATVATLGTGYSLYGYQTLTDTAKLVYAVAMICVGLSLACAVKVLTPEFLKINLNSLQSFDSEFSRSIKSRRAGTIAAGFFLALAFVVAGFVPVSSVFFPTPPGSSLSYSYDGKQLTIKLTLKDLNPGSEGRFEVTKVLTDQNKVSRTVTFFADHFIADPNGKADRSAILTTSAIDPLTIHYKAVGKNSKVAEGSEILHLATP